MKQSISTQSEFVSTEEAAVILGMTGSGVRRRCEAGKIPATKVGRSWIIASSALAGVSRSKAGHPYRAAPGENSPAPEN
jgi:excisionase family DNA binding protein